MGTREMLAKVGMTREQVKRAAGRYGRKPADDDNELESGEDLADAIAENRPGYTPDLFSSHDAMYHGSLMRD